LAAFFAASGSLSGCFARLRSQIAPRNSREIPEERVRLLSLKMAAHSKDAKKLFFEILLVFFLDPRLRLPEKISKS
jgi:hypothetical protein